MALGVSILFIAGLAVDVLGFILHVVGMATTEWSVYSNSEIGVFKGCGLGVCGEIKDPNSDQEAVQAMVIIAVLCAVAAIIVAIVHIVWGAMGKAQIQVLPIVAAVLSMVAFGFILLGVIIYGAAVHADFAGDPDIGYSFALTLVGGILLLIGGVLLFIGKSGTAVGGF